MKALACETTYGLRKFTANKSCGNYKVWTKLLSPCGDNTIVVIFTVFGDNNPSVIFTVTIPYTVGNLWQEG